jgi:hypothetical protein
MVVPIYKKWEASSVRVQIVQQESVIQLLAFFEDYSHSDAMGFLLKSTDVFEKAEKSGKQAVKLVDAKFPLPPEAEKGRPPDPARRFVCLDMPEYAGEHDDITVGFNSEDGKIGSRSHQDLILTKHRSRTIRGGSSRSDIYWSKSECLQTTNLILSRSSSCSLHPMHGLRFLCLF